MAGLISGDASGAEGHRRNNFDSLRLFGAVLVIYGHAFALTGMPEPGFAANSVQTIGVKIFFVLSGYLIIRSWLRDPNPLRYATRRALRIWPAFLAVIVLTILVIGPLCSTLPAKQFFASRATWGYLHNATFYISYWLPGVFTHNIYPNAVNGSFWTLPVEVSMYVLVPAVIALLAPLQQLRLPALAGLTVVLAVLALGTVAGGNLPAPIVIYATNFWFWLELAPYFLAGACVALGRWERFLDVHVGMLLLLITAMAGRGPITEEAMLQIALPYAALAFGLGHSRLLGSLTASGDYSYGLYLWGFPVQQMLVASIGTPHPSFLGIGLINPALVIFALSLAITFVLAVLSWHLLEKRALALKPYRARQAPSLLTS